MRRICLFFLLTSVPRLYGQTSQSAGFDPSNAIIPTLTITPLPTPGAPTVVETGQTLGPGSITWSYVVVAILPDQNKHTPASPVGSTTTGYNTLTASVCNVLNWPIVPGATGYFVYRVTAGANPFTLGKLNPAPLTTATFTDCGLPADNTTAPTTNTTGTAAIGSMPCPAGVPPGSICVGQALMFPLNVVQLPAPTASNKNLIAVVGNGTSGSDCTAGGGTTQALCISNGSAWVSLGGSGGSGSGTVTNVSGSVPSWLTVNVTNPTTTPAITITATPGQTPHQVIGTCNAGTSFAPCVLVPLDLPATTVNSVVNDTNVTGSIATQALTLGWTGTLAKNRIISTAIFNDQANTYSLGLQDFSAVTWKIPTGSGFTASAVSMFGYDSTGTHPHLWANGVDTSITPTAIANGVPQASSGGLISTAWLGGGVATNMTFLRGDQQWATPAGGGNVSTSGSPLTNQVALFSSSTTITGTVTDSVTTHALFATAGAPAFRAIVAGDIPTLNQNTTGTAANVTGVVATANGGTGTASTLTGLVRGGSPMTAAEISGDGTTSGSNVLTNTKVNGVAYPSGPSTNTVPVVTGSNTITYEIVPVAAGGSGTATPSLVAGTNVTITGSWPNQTVTSSGTGGGASAASGLTDFNCVRSTVSNPSDTVTCSWPTGGANYGNNGFIIASPPSSSCVVTLTSGAATATSFYVYWDYLAPTGASVATSAANFTGVGFSSGCVAHSLTSASGAPSNTYQLVKLTAGAVANQFDSFSACFPSNATGCIDQRAINRISVYAPNPSGNLKTLPGSNGAIYFDFDGTVPLVLGANSYNTDGTVLGTDISTPSNPSAGKTKYYTKGGKLCSLNPSGTENCTGGTGVSVDYIRLMLGGCGNTGVAYPGAWTSNLQSGGGGATSFFCATNHIPEMQQSDQTDFAYAMFTFPVSATSIDVEFTALMDTATGSATWNVGIDCWVPGSTYNTLPTVTNVITSGSQAFTVTGGVPKTTDVVVTLGTTQMNNCTTGSNRLGMLKLIRTAATNNTYIMGGVTMKVTP